MGWMVGRVEGPPRKSLVVLRFRLTDQKGYPKPTMPSAARLGVNLSTFGQAHDQVRCLTSSGRLPLASALKNQCPAGSATAQVAPVPVLTLSTCPSGLFLSTGGGGHLIIVGIPQETRSRTQPTYPYLHGLYLPLRLRPSLHHARQTRTTHQSTPLAILRPHFPPHATRAYILPHTLTLSGGPATTDKDLLFSWGRDELSGWS